MKNPKFESYILLGAIVAILIVVFFIFKPFLSPLVLAILFAVLFHPLHRRILRFMPKWPSLAAICSTLLVMIFILGPLVFLGIQIFQEAKQMYGSILASGSQHGLIEFSNSMQEKFNKIMPTAENISLNLDGYLKQALGGVVKNLGSVFSSVAKIIASAFLFLIALYYLFKDGEKFKQALIRVSPLSDSSDEDITSKLALAINSVIKGSLAIALIQGIVATGGYLLFGLPNPVLWGTITAIAALIPGVGTSLVLIPAIIYLTLSGNLFGAIGLLIWGTFAVGLIDNFLGPKLMSRGMEVHPFLVLLSVLGGLAFFGPLGFLLGPLTLSLLFALFSIYFELSQVK